MNNPQIHHIHQRNTLRTIRKYTTPTNEIRNEHPANTPHSPTKHTTNNPQIHNSHQRNSQRTIRQA
ncbi:hypothetical protein [Prevotella pallens]|uniref:hypothetical protein n=1 Tax=Prevotella pallens TaxID=60133 RepID=UPI0028E98C3F|nr:hypothetical protein [Prevotella pallens]